MNELMNNYKHILCINSIYHFSDARFNMRNIQGTSYISPENTVRLLAARPFYKHFYFMRLMGNISKCISPSNKRVGLVKFV